MTMLSRLFQAPKLSQTPKMPYTKATSHLRRFGRCMNRRCVSHGHRIGYLFNMTKSKFSPSHYGFITERDIRAAQKSWGAGIIAIGASNTPKEEAEAFIKEHYDYGKDRKVLFKPTLAKEHIFRDTKEEALSYFIGGLYPEDRGFALQRFTRITFKNNGIILNGTSASAMGQYWFTTRDGNEINAAYSFGYIERGGVLKINLHHSSLPPPDTSS